MYPLVALFGLVASQATAAAPLEQEQRQAPRPDTEPSKPDRARTVIGGEKGKGEATGPSQPSVPAKSVLAGYQQSCPGSHDGEVVVCAHLQDETYRLRPLPDKYEHDNPLGHILDVQIAPGVHIHGVGIRITF